MVNTIDSEFRKKLDKLNPDRPFMVVIHPKPSQSLEATLDEHGLPPRNQGENQENYNHRLNEFLAESLKPLCQYLDDRNIQYKKMEAIGFVAGKIKIRDIYQLAEQPFIDAIMDGEEQIFRAAN